MPAYYWRSSRYHGPPILSCGPCGRAGSGLFRVPNTSSAWLNIIVSSSSSCHPRADQASLRRRGSTSTAPQGLVFKDADTSARRVKEEQQRKALRGGRGLRNSLHTLSHATFGYFGGRKEEEQQRRRLQEMTPDTRSDPRMRTPSSLSFQEGED